MPPRCVKQALHIDPYFILFIANGSRRGPFPITGTREGDGNPLNIKGLPSPLKTAAFVVAGRIRWIIFDAIGKAFVYPLSKPLARRFKSRIRA